ncbi:MAG: hypothetical protein H6824_21410 [Planctomycetaceae bacterium]|nr:hypothetical protein [Planctomycetaceae bacterium]
MNLRVSSLLVLCCAGSLFAQETLDEQFSGNRLPDTKLLTEERPLHEVMVEQISLYAEDILGQVQDARWAPWISRNGEPAKMTQEEARQFLRKYIGAVDPAVEHPEIHRRTLMDESGRRVESIRWDVMEGVTGDGLMVQATDRENCQGVVVLLADADTTPESLLGWYQVRLDDWKLVQGYVDAGYDVYIPRLIPRTQPDDAFRDKRLNNISPREFVYRTSFELGRHPVGYETQRVLALGRALHAEFPNQEIQLVGMGEGGMLSLYAGALGEEFSRVVVRGYFGQHRRVWEEPLDRNIQMGQGLFGNAELATLIAPRAVSIDISPVRPYEGPKADPPIRDIAGPGTTVSPEREEVMQEFGRVVQYMVASGGPVHVAILEKPIPKKDLAFAIPEGLDVPKRVQEHQQQQLRELILHTQALLHRSDKVRQELWNSADRSSIEAWTKSAAEFREMVHEDLIGKLPLANAEAMNPRSRRVIDADDHVGFEIALDVYEGESPQNFIASGVLLVPKGIKAGERRPVVVCQHGLEGTPFDTITMDESNRAYGAYKGFSTQLVKKGFIVYAPQNPYKGYHDFRVIQRKSNPVGRTLFSYIIEQHRQSLHWLATLPYVDADRIAFYGLSYGGKTAVRVPPLLVDKNEDGTHKPLYCLSICSADYNEWIRKNCSAEDRYSYVFTPEYEIFEWDMGHLADYSELANLMAPRPFMVERGHNDGVAPDEWVAWEYAKVRRHYTFLGLEDKTEIEWFNGPHTINGQGTFRFLERHLNWSANQ